MMTIATAEPMTITTIDGETRLVVKNWDNGAWDCPFCGTPNDPCSEYHQQRGWEAPCGNPACIVGGCSSVGAVAEIRLAQQRAREESSQRAWLADFLEEQRTRREQDRTAAVTAFAAEAQEHGYCLTCWNHSTSYGLWLGRAKTVRHRAPGNCPTVRRRKS